ncbi:MAG TPA: long-chain fatty acid--CoA ligase [Leptospiraceae bacterium]|nr:long-chain fatty acid--CoA ligase [Leptospirales bacterium]HMW58334.1 long-chain fatty acid--CoA ligase [Leptospiraceae bacterium]HMX57512.1 long-chain fatty acid--CoA ligase [Leptospiraceae bacterium]HNE21520.1 long-chain fatty acid--CoA ligase [Leptospiraceae bacterium]HNJ32784.1 long-chain fatty acid--CoA ligase [Leptospiraceae bacterium]
MYREAAQLFGNLPAFGTRQKDKTWKQISYAELYETGVNLATALIDLGVQQREHVALLADNRVEWIIADYGCQLAGAADVPRGTDVTDADIQYILPHSDAKVCFVEHKEMLSKVQKNLDKCPNIKTLIVMDQGATASGGNVLSMYDLIAKGKELRAKGDKRVEERIESTKPDDLFTLIYTSGTTGAPKGVMLMHSNMISQTQNIPIPITTADRILSILPVWHIFERVFEMMAVSQGACTYYTNIRNIGDDMKNVKPTFMGSAPRLWENIYLKILNNVKGAPPIRRALFNAAYFCSLMFQGSLFFLTGRSLDMEGRNPLVSIAMGILHILRLTLFAIPYFLLDVIVLKKLRGATGGALKGSVSGGGALPLHVDQFFNYIGIPVLEGYGMTETCPVLAVRSWKKLVIGSVGPIFPGTQIRLMDLNTGDVIYPNDKRRAMGRGIKGEIHAKGPQVMKGYYKNPEATAKVLKDGWMNTGDMGMITFNDCVKIMGRSKDTVVLQNGENVEPVPIENKMCESVFIDQVMVVGQDQKFLAALVVPSVEEFKKFGIPAETVEELARNPEVLRVIKEEIARLVSGENGFKAFERMQDARVVPKAFEVGDEMTNLFKLKRHIITDKYKSLIDDIYKEK